jgi:hypothetical protein
MSGPVAIDASTLDPPCVLMDPELTDCFRLKAEIRLTVLDNGSCRVAQRNFTPGRSQNRA